MQLDEATGTPTSVISRQTDRLVLESQLECLLGAIGALLACYALLGSTTLVPLAAWTAVAVVSYGMRYMLIQRAQDLARSETSPATLYPLYLATLALSGVAWGAGIAWLLATSGLNIGTTPMLLLGVSVVMCSVAIHAGVPKATQLIIASVLLPPMLTVFSLPMAAALPIALGLVYAAVAAYFCAQHLRDRLWIATAALEETEQLRSYLDQRRNQVEKLKVEVKTSQSKRDEAEIAMRRMAADLGLLQGKSKALSDTLERLSPIDQITGLDNRRHFEQTADAEWRRAGREEKVVSMVVLELDDFEDFVAANNRQTVDTVLKRLGVTVRSFGRRAGDTAARYDEGRLALLLPGCDSKNAERLAETIRKKIESLPLPQNVTAKARHLTAHLGVATAKPGRGVGSDELFKRVEEALYESSFQGGNRVAVHRPLNRLKVERWELADDGPLSEQAMTQKLLVWGFESARELMAVGTRAEPQSWDEETAIGITAGELSLEVEGHDMLIKNGDCVIIPSGIEVGQHVVGTRPVLKLMATKLQ